MYFRIVAENISNRTFNVAQNEGVYRGTILRTVKHIGDKRIIHCRCESSPELARIIATLETDQKASISFVENSFGETISFRDLAVADIPHYSRHTLSLAS